MESKLYVGNMAKTTTEDELRTLFTQAGTVSLVEVIQSDATDIKYVERTMKLLADAGMSPVHVKRDIPGFIGNRLQHALKREAIALVANGVCDAETLDKVSALADGPIRLLVAARLGRTRLIDNLGV